MHEQNELNAVAEEKFQEEQAAEPVAEGTEEVFAENAVSVEEANEPMNTDNENFELTGNLMNELLGSLESETMECAWGICPRYCYADSDLDGNMVYAWDCQDWLLYGFDFRMDGDHVVIDFDSRRRMKYTIVEFDEGEQASPFMAAYTAMAEKLGDASQWESKYQSASDTITSMETELGELRQFKADTENEALQSAREAVFARFEDLVGVEAFETLRENAADFQLDELEEKCFAIRGRNGTTAKFSHEEKAPKLKVAHEDDLKKEPYGGIFAHFGIEAE